RLRPARFQRKRQSHEHNFHRQTFRRSSDACPCQGLPGRHRFPLEAPSAFFWSSIRLEEFSARSRLICPDRRGVWAVSAHSHAFACVRRINMKKLMWFMSGIALMLAVTPQAGTAPLHQAASSAPPQSEDKTAPSYDMKAQAALDLQQMQQKFTSLAEAIPPEKYNWRPS